MVTQASLCKVKRVWRRPGRLPTHRPHWPRRSACRVRCWPDSGPSPCGRRESDGGTRRRRTGRCRGGDSWRHLDLLHHLGAGEPGERDLRGGGMGALRIAVERLGQLPHSRPGKPVVGGEMQLAAWRLLQAALGIDLGKGRTQGSDVAAVAVEEEDVSEAMPRQRLHGVAQHGDQRAGTQADGAGKGQVVLSHAQVLGRRHQHAVTLTDLPGDGFRADGVGSHQTVGAVLFGGADRYDDTGLAGQVGLDLLPGSML